MANLSQAYSLTKSINLKSRDSRVKKIASIYIEKPCHKCTPVDQTLF